MIIDDPHQKKCIQPTVNFVCVFCPSFLVLINIELSLMNDGSRKRSNPLLERFMLIKSNQMAVMCLMIAMIAVTSPAIARSRVHDAGHHAHAQATGGDLGSGVMSVDRAADIRACNAKASHWSQYTWGVTESHQYRGCMSERGQPE